VVGLVYGGYMGFDLYCTVSKHSSLKGGARLRKLLILLVTSFLILCGALVGQPVSQSVSPTPYVFLRLPVVPRQPTHSSSLPPSLPPPVLSLWWCAWVRAVAGGGGGGGKNGTGAGHDSRDKTN